MLQASPSTSFEVVKRLHPKPVYPPTGGGPSSYRSHLGLSVFSAPRPNLSADFRILRDEADRGAMSGLRIWLDATVPAARSFSARKFRRDEVARFVTPIDEPRSPL